MKTTILPVPEPDSLGSFQPRPAGKKVTSPIHSRLDHWQSASDPSVAPGLPALRTAAAAIRNTDTPVGFPTETVYGLGADATRSAAVRGIFATKGRPSDNPLIVHVCDLDMLRELLEPGELTPDGDLPEVYRPLVERFWPGPLTILLPLAKRAHSAENRAKQGAEDLVGASSPVGSSAQNGSAWDPRAKGTVRVLAPETTAGLSTFGCRLPASPLSRTLIRLADAPLAGPSANASTRPSPTTAQHVVDDLQGRIQYVLDGGPCGVGVESTVVDGLCSPPVILRPGGISEADLRTVPGWENVTRGYDIKGKDDQSENAPRAPGMKYKHYSPKARVVLYEMAKDDSLKLGADDLTKAVEAAAESADGGGSQGTTVAVIRTGAWPSPQGNSKQTNGNITYNLEEYPLNSTTVLDLDLGRDLPSIAHGLFYALRDLDARGADVILVEGIDDRGDDMASAVMNRLRKAASEIR